MRAKDYFPPGVQLNLAEAAAKGDLGKINEAIVQGAKVNDFGGRRMTPLMWAIAKQNIKGYERLLEQGANPNLMTRDSSKYDQGRSIMMVSAACENSEYLRLALIHNGSPDAPSWVPSQTIIFDAVNNRRIQNIKLIHDFGGNLNHRDSRGVTPIIEATYSSNYDVVYALLQLGADPDIKNNSGSNVATIMKRFQDRAAFAFGDRSQKAWYEKVVLELNRGNHASKPLVSKTGD